MARKYQGHERLDKNIESTRNTTTSSKGKKKKKKEKVFSIGFTCTSLIIAIITFFVCFVVGAIIGPDLPF